jgi:hypothetical protein
MHSNKGDVLPRLRAGRRVIDVWALAGTRGNGCAAVMESHEVTAAKGFAHIDL